MVLGSIPIVGNPGGLIGGGIPGVPIPGLGSPKGNTVTVPGTQQPAARKVPLYEEVEYEFPVRGVDPNPQEEETPYLLYAGAGVAGLLVLYVGYRALS